MPTLYFRGLSWVQKGSRGIVFRKHYLFSKKRCFDRFCFGTRFFGGAPGGRFGGALHPTGVENRFWGVLFWMPIFRYFWTPGYCLLSKRLFRYHAYIVMLGTFEWITLSATCAQAIQVGLQTNHLVSTLDQQPPQA